MEHGSVEDALGGVDAVEHQRVEVEVEIERAAGALDDVDGARAAGGVTQGAGAAREEAEDGAQEEKPAVEWLCSQVAKRNLTTPGLIGLEMSRPLNWIAAQTMHYTSPGIWAIARQQTYENYKHFANFLERRGSIEYLCRRIEELEAEYEKQETKRDASTPSIKAAEASSETKESDESD